MAFKGTAPHVTGCESLFINLGSKDQLKSLASCCIATSLPERPDSISGLIVEIPRPGEFQSAFLGNGLQGHSHYDNCGPIPGHLGPVVTHLTSCFTVLVTAVA